MAATSCSPSDAVIAHNETGLLLRTHSPVLTKFPWMTGALRTQVDVRAIACPAHSLSGFLSQLRSFEAGTLLSPESVEGKYYRHLLHIQFTDEQPPQLCTTIAYRGSPKDWGFLASVVCAYRLADVVALLETREILQPVAIFRQPKEGPISPLPSYAQLEDWTKLLKSFRDTFRRDWKTMPMLASDANEDAKLLKGVVSCCTLGDLSNMGANCLTAAIHMAYLMRHSFKPNQLPELTENFQELQCFFNGSPVESSNISTLAQLSEAEIDFWTGIFGKNSGNASTKSRRERQPLHLALAISPLYLLVSSQLMKPTIGRENVICTAVALGNQRPASLLLVEKAIWSTILRVADKAAEPSLIMKELYNAIPWEVVDTCSDADKSWFKLPKPSPKSTIDLPSIPLVSLSLPESQTTASFHPIEPPQGTILDVANPNSARSHNSPLPGASSPSSHSLITASSHFIGPPSQDTNLNITRSEEEMDVEPRSPILPSLEESYPLPVSLAASSHLNFDKAMSADPCPSNPPSPFLSSSSLSSLVTSRFSTKSPSPFSSGSSSSPVSQLHSNGLSASSVARASSGRIIVPPRLISVTSPSPSSTPNDLMDDCLTAPQDDDEGLESDHDMQVDNQDEPPKRSSERLQGLANEVKTTPQLPAFNQKHNPKNNRTKAKNGKKAVDVQTGGKRKQPPTLNARTADEPKIKRTALTPSLTGLPIGGEDPENPIDVDEYCLFAHATNPNNYDEVDALQPLLQTPKRRYALSQGVRVWDAYQQSHSVSPRLHSLEELIKFAKIMETAERSHTQNQAKHVSDPDSSVFHILDYGQYSRMSDREITDLLKEKSVVVRNMEWQDMRFDEEGLSTLGSLQVPVSIQDLSRSHPQNDLSERLVHGSVLQMLESSRAGQRSKALNGLSFPFETAIEEDTRFATCRVAWKNTARLVTQRPGSAKFPISDVHWGLAATEGAATFWHIDSDGLATTVDVRAGEKLWIVGRGKPEDYSELGLLLSNAFDLDKPPQAFDTEAILLTEKTRLIMRPGVVHAVYTPRHSICHGSHFYCTASIQSTLASLIHGFICHDYITNISHPDTRALLRRMIHFFHLGLVEGAYMTDSQKAHLPKLNTPPGTEASIDDVLNLLAACTLVFLSNALDPRTYTPPGRAEGSKPSESQKYVMEVHHANAISPVEREEICEARGVVLDTFSWFRSNFSVLRDGTSESIDLVSIYLTEISRSILRYKQAASLNSVHSAADFSVEDLEKQIEDSLELDGESWRLWVQQHQSSWLDSEIKDEQTVLIGECNSFQLKCGGDLLNIGKEAEARFDSERNVVDVEEGDLKIDLADCIYEPPKVEAKTFWRKEKLWLADWKSYSVTRKSNVEALERLKRDDFVAAGSSHFDNVYRGSMEWRHRQEGLAVKMERVKRS